MTDEKGKAIEATTNSEQPELQSLELDEELSELDLEDIAGASCGSQSNRETR